MRRRSAYLRDQAEKCRWHADRLSEAETQAELRALADRYAAKAAAIEAEWPGSSSEAPVAGAPAGGRPAQPE